jgi:SAM-dependent methyltransferase
MFPLDFPLEILGVAKPGQWVLDPFCGRGTTLFAARRLGLGGVGIDISPVAAAIAQAKVLPIDPKKVEAQAIEMLSGGYKPQDVPAGEFWSYLYHHDTLKDVCSLREQLLQRSRDRTAAILRAVTLGILHGPIFKNPTYLSNQMPRTYSTKPAGAVRFWKSRSMEPPYVPVLETLLKRIRYTLAVVPPASMIGDVWHGDAREVLPRLRRRFDWVVTSPPYYGMNTYVPDQWLRNWFLGGPPFAEYNIAGQIAHGGVEGFTLSLASVWRAASARCRPGATLAIRFGALPSARVDAEGLLLQSLADSGVGWSVLDVRDAGQPDNRARQAVQFKGAGQYSREIDCIAVLT